MPAKIAIKDMKEWLDLFESGTPLISIATDKHHDVRTIKSGIDRAKRERAAEAVRLDTMRKAVGGHQEALVSTVNEIGKGLVIPMNAFAAINERDGEYLLVQAPEIRRQPTDTWSVTLSPERTPYWQLLRQHLPRDPLWEGLNRWKKVTVDLVTACAELRARTSQLLMEKCQCQIVDRDDGTPFLFTMTPQVMYAEVLFKAADHKPGTDLGRDIRVDRRNGQVTFSGGILARAPGRVDEFADHIRDTLKKLGKSAEKAKVSFRYQTFVEATEKARRAAEDITLLGMVPGLCRICRKLGL